MPEADTLRLSGHCGLRTIRARRDEVSAALDAAAGLVVDCADAEGIDVSFVQLIASATKTAERTAKPFHVTNLSAAGQAAFDRAGVATPGR